MYIYLPLSAQDRRSSNDGQRDLLSIGSADKPVCHLLPAAALLAQEECGRRSRDEPREACQSYRIRPEHHVLPPPVICQFSTAA